MVSVRTGILRETHTYAQVGSTGDRTGDTHIHTGREYRTHTHIRTGREYRRHTHSHR